MAMGNHIHTKGKVKQTTKCSINSLYSSTTSVRWHQKGELVDFDEADEHAG